MHGSGRVQLQRVTEGLSAKVLGRVPTEKQYLRELVWKEAAFFFFFLRSFLDTSELENGENAFINVKSKQHINKYWTRATLL